MIITLPTGPKFDLPLTMMPVFATTNTGIPATLVRTLPLNSIVMLLNPFAIEGAIGAEAKNRLPLPSVVNMLLALPPCILTFETLPKFASPVFITPVALTTPVIIPAFVNCVTFGVPATLTLILVLDPTMILLLPFTID